MTLADNQRFRGKLLELQAKNATNKARADHVVARIREAPEITEGIKDEAFKLLITATSGPIRFVRVGDFRDFEGVPSNDDWMRFPGDGNAYNDAERARYNAPFLFMRDAMCALSEREVLDKPLFKSLFDKFGDAIKYSTCDDEMDEAILEVATVGKRMRMGRVHRLTRLAVYNEKLEDAKRRSERDPVRKKRFETWTEFDVPHKKKIKL